MADCEITSSNHPTNTSVGDYAPPMAVVVGDDFEPKEMKGQYPQKKPMVSTSTSEVWKFFTKKGAGKDGIPRATCNGCGQEYKCGGSKYGTSILRHHIPSCTKTKFN